MSFQPFGTTQGAQQAKRPEVIRLPSGLELSGPIGSERLRGSQAERRFSALNPHGNIGTLFFGLTFPTRY